MTSMERVRLALDYRPADRIPTYDCYMLGFAEAWRKCLSLPDTVIPEDYYAIDIRQCWVNSSPLLERKTLRETDTDLWLLDGYGRECHQIKGQPGEEYLAFAINEPADLDRLAFVPALDERRYAEYASRMAELKQNACPFGSILGLFMTCWYLRGETGFLMDIAGDPVFCRELVDRCAEFIGDVAVEAVRYGRLQECGIWFFDDMAMNSAPLLSPAAFAEFLLPAYKRIIGRVRAAGARKVMLHCDGNFESLLELVIEAGFDVIQPVEAKAGMDIVRLRDRYAPRLAFVGGMCNALTLPNGPLEKIRKETLRILDAAKDGGIVIGTHSIGADIPPAHYEYYMSIVRNTTSAGKRDAV